MIVPKVFAVTIVLALVSPVPVVADDTAFLDQVTTGTPSEVQAPINAGADVNASTPDGWTALVWAAGPNTNPEVFAELLKAGAKVSARIPYGRSALMEAAAHNSNPEVLTTLLNAGAKGNTRDMGGRTALVLAAGFNTNLEVLSVLLKAGADTNAQDGFGKTTRDYVGENEKPWGADAYSRMLQMLSPGGLVRRRGMGA